MCERLWKDLWEGKARQGISNNRLLNHVRTETIYLRSFNFWMQFREGGKGKNGVLLTKVRTASEVGEFSAVSEVFCSCYMSPSCIDHFVVIWSKCCSNVAWYEWKSKKVSFCCSCSSCSWVIFETNKSLSSNLTHFHSFALESMRCHGYWICLPNIQTKMNVVGLAFIFSVCILYVSVSSHSDIT